HFYLPQQVHYLLRRMLLPPCHRSLLDCQFLSKQLVQKTPGTPRGVRGRYTLRSVVRQGSPLRSDRYAAR
ncbi:hypothetical protein, partial [Granulicella paludicola]|uniref:hypothetical protein n=1 Tax=Granulicella paludicola TaxID=474951 RepID=UPI0021E005F5